VSAPDPTPTLAPLRRALDDVRAATTLTRARPAYAAGLRAALATTVPLLLDHFVHTGGGTWMSVAGFLGALADKGGPYRTRATTLLALTPLAVDVPQHLARSSPNIPRSPSRQRSSSPRPAAWPGPTATPA
jgi:hypothetical protein